ncbi:hypothetical protein GKZ89_13610 [Bacillus mangrovi]|uniref:YtkA-like domain-containing protein n=2 Tax=Metabacillus mangrovi TaxID=1491830 RepID=A0A7X2V5G8_9BACI|nr:hypothetical protein [Metabacillus mangrovi]
MLFAGCQGSKASDLPEMVEAKIIIPEKLDPGSTQELKVKVTQGGEIVQDANEVEFEIWKSGEKESSEMLEAKHAGDGIYSVKKTFGEDGIFYVQTHVTARDMHVMPKTKITVGQAGAEPEEEQDEELEHHHH